jgi:hypothetical protein
MSTDDYAPDSIEEISFHASQRCNCELCRLKSRKLLERDITAFLSAFRGRCIAAIRARAANCLPDSKKSMAIESLAKEIESLELESPPKG